MTAVGFAVCVLAHTIVHACISHMCVLVFECVYFLVAMFYSYVHKYIIFCEHNALTPLLRQSSLATILYSCEVINDWYEATAVNIWRLYCKLISSCVRIQFQVACECNCHLICDLSCTDTVSECTSYCSSLALS